LCTRDPSMDQNKLWLRVKGWKIYEDNGFLDRSSNTYIRQSRLQTYIGQMRQRRTQHTNKRSNASKGNNNYHLIRTQLHQTHINGLKKHI
jgi:hypothetical protein